MAAEQYVKFRRGSNTDFQNLAVKDADTLYFIYDENESTADLYLGSKKISGDDGVSITNLSQLQDLSLSNLSDNDILIYDTTDKIWINKPVENILSDYVENISTKVKVITNTDQKSHNEIMQSQQEPTSGNILIIKDLIAEDTYQHTAYVYSDNEWHAMDGNYSAETIYFNNDFIFTKDLGAIEVPEDTGNITVEAKGKNLKEFLSSVFAKEENPKITQPSASIKLIPTTNSYEVGSEYSPSYKITFNPGSYSYGPITDVRATYSIMDTEGNTSEAFTGSFNTITITDNIQYQISADVSYSDGTVPKTNLQNDYLDGQIKAGTLDTITTSMVTGYRNCFYGTTTEKSDLTSDVIRSLKATDKAVTEDSQFTINIPVGVKRVIFAYPDTVQEVTSVKDVNGMYAEIVSGFKQEIIPVEGANHYTASNYKVYTMDYAIPTTEVNAYEVTI